jgi:hypothetical protein
MGRCVRTFGHVAKIAHETLVNHFPIVVFGNAIDFHGWALIHQIKQGGKRAAQTHTTTAPMANIKDPLKFFEA